MQDRPMNINNYLENLDFKVESIFKSFYDFTSGVRMIILLERKKDGGHNKEDRRTLCTRFTFSSEEYKYALKEMLLLRLIYPETRLYSSVNSRNLKKIIRNVETSLLDAHYADEECSFSVHKKLIKAPRHYVMQQSVSDTSFFVLDVDDVEGKDTYGEALQKCAELEIEILKAYKTKNGWHIITKPFNPSIWTLCEIKKDALILLDY